MAKTVSLSIPSIVGNLQRLSSAWPRMGRCEGDSGPVGGRGCETGMTLLPSHPSSSAPWRSYVEAPGRTRERSREPGVLARLCPFVSFPWLGHRATLLRECHPAVLARPPAARLGESDVRETPHRVSLVSLGNRVGLSGELWDDDRPDGRPHGDLHVS